MNSNLMALCSEKVKRALNQVSGGLCYFTAEAKHAQLLDVQKTLSEIEDALASPKAATQPPNALPARILAMCKKRGWDLSWSSRGVYLHLEASELIEALRGKRSDPLSEAADVLLVLMSITENAGIPWCDVLNQTAMTCARLEVCDPYPGEERGALTQSAPAPEATQPAPPAAPVGGLVERLRTSVRQLPGVYLLDDECQVAIREVAAWLDLEGYNRAANDLRREAGK